MKKLFIAIAILASIAVTSTIGYGIVYLYKPSYSSKASLSMVYLNTDSTIIAATQGGQARKLEYFNSATSTLGTKDTTPDVSYNTVFLTPTTATITNTFDGGSTGQKIYVVSKASYTFSTGGNLAVGSAALSTDSLDVTEWVYDGSLWYLTGYYDNSDDNN